MVKDYLDYLAINSGIGNSYDDLLAWQVIEESDLDNLNDSLNYALLRDSISNLTQLDVNDLISKKILSKHQDTYIINKQTAISVVDKALEYINNKTFTNIYDYELKDNENIFYDEQSKTYKIKENDEIRDASFEDVYSSLNISDTYEIDFTDAEVIPLNTEEESSYINNRYNLLASNKNHVFNTDGYRVSYTLNSSGINVHVSKELDKGRIYFDLGLNKVKPSFKWTYEEGDLKNCYFNISMNTSEKLGVSIGKYGNYYLDLKDLDSSSFMNKINSLIKTKDDEVIANIPICEIKTPIPNVPTATINLRLLIKLYASGKMELALYNTLNTGFETKDGKIRYFFNHNDDINGTIRSSGKAALGINVGVDATNFRLFDIELDGGLKTVLASTIHLYDSDGNLSNSDSEIAYSILEELSKENPNVLICGDLSLYWMFDILFNTSKTVMYKLGFNKTFHILDEDNQVFNNLHHIENGVFVKECTRKNKTTLNGALLSVNGKDKIVLASYAEVLQIGETYQIQLESIPSDYESKNIRYESLNEQIATVSNGEIVAKTPGSVKIRVYTSDNKYSAFINVLVSTG